MDGLAYIPGNEQVKNLPLAQLPSAPPLRHCHRLPCQPCRSRPNPKGAWVLDPFGASPQLAVEIAAAGLLGPGGRQ